MKTFHGLRINGLLLKKKDEEVQQNRGKGVMIFVENKEEPMQRIKKITIYSIWKAVS